MHNVLENNRVHLNIKFLQRISKSSLASLKPKHLQQFFYNFIRKRVTANSSECSSALVSGQSSRPYKRTGMHVVVIECWHCHYRYFFYIMLMVHVCILVCFSSLFSLDSDQKIHPIECRKYTDLFKRAIQSFLSTAGCNYKHIYIYIYIYVCVYSSFGGGGGLYIYS